MTMEIIRNCSHLGDTCTALVIDGRGRPSRLVKTAFTAAGSRDLGRENEAVSWYDGRRQVPSAAVSFEQRPAWGRLELRYERGDCGDLGLSVAANRKKILSALRHHVSVFDGTPYSHGDYSIENIVYAGDMPARVLDWEAFNRELPPDFDMVYCVLEACFFCLKRRHRLSSGDIQAAGELLRFVKDHARGGLNDGVAPAAYIARLFTAHKTVFGGQYAKYPFLTCPAEDITKLDGLLKQWEDMR